MAQTDPTTYATFLLTLVRMDGTITSQLANGEVTCGDRQAVQEVILPISTAVGKFFHEWPRLLVLVQHLNTSAVSF